jgi:two-component sensor histidine kinase
MILSRIVQRAALAFRRGWVRKDSVMSIDQIERNQRLGRGPSLPFEKMRALTSSEIQMQLRRVAEFGCVTAVYIAVAKLSLAVASVNPSATPIWPPTGLALAIILLRGYGLWPAIFVAAFITNATTAGSLATSLAIAGGNTLECLIGAYLLNRLSQGPRTFETPGGVARFTLLCFVPSTVVSATVGVVSLSLAGFAEWSKFAAIWTTWWMGDLTGALLVTPVIVLWATGRHSLAQSELRASGAVFVATIAVGLIAFSPLVPQAARQGWLAFLSIGPLMWAALYRNQRDTATAALILAGFAVWDTLYNGGPFARGDINDSFLLLLTFLISISVPSLALSADVATRQRREEHLNLLTRELTHRSKNLLAVIQSMVRQVIRGADNIGDLESAFDARLRALAETHDLLVDGGWRSTDLRDLIAAQLSPFRTIEDAPAVGRSSPRLNPKAAELIGMALYELGTNAVKYGALSVRGGTVKLEWQIAAGGNFVMRWKERGGPPVQKPQRTGFGHQVITNIVPATLQGTANLDYDTEGVCWTIFVPPDSIFGDGDGAGSVNPDSMVL